MYTLNVCSSFVNYITISLKGQGPHLDLNSDFVLAVSMKLSKSLGVSVFVVFICKEALSLDCQEGKQCFLQSPKALANDETSIPSSNCLMIVA